MIVTEALQIKRMEIYMADIPLLGGSVQYGVRPVIIVQNNLGNLTSPNVIVVPLTTKNKKWLKVHVHVSSSLGIPVDSTVLCEQIMTLPKGLLINKIGEITDENIIRRIDKAIQISLNVGRGKIDYADL